MWIECVNEGGGRVADLCKGCGRDRKLGYTFTRKCSWGRHAEKSIRQASKICSLPWPALPCPALPLPFVALKAQADSPMVPNRRNLPYSPSRVQRLVTAESACRVHTGGPSIRDRSAWESIEIAPPKP